MSNNILLHQIPLSDLRSFINKAVAEQFEKYQLNKSERTEKLLNSEEVSKLFGITKPTLHTYEKNGIIKAVRIGTRVRYRLSDVNNALQYVKTINK